MPDNRIPLPMIAILGAAAASPELEEAAERVGAEAARQGWVVLTGGGPGVMAAASRGAVEAGGLTVGVLPGAGPIEGYPNRWIVLPIFTGIGAARNVVNVLSAGLCVALGGGGGTLSEVAHALKAGKEVWCWDGWSLEAPQAYGGPVPRVFAELEDLLTALASHPLPTAGPGGN